MLRVVSILKSAQEHIITITINSSKNVWNSLGLGEKFYLTDHGVYDRVKCIRVYHRC